MGERLPVGLLKFFERDDYIDSLLGGTVFFAAPETYRADGHEGRGDPQESCAAAYRMQAGDLPLQMKFGDQEFQVTALTVHSAGRKQGWLHCWFAIELPTDFEELERLIEDINRMRDQFGSRYVFLHAERIDNFVDRVRGSLPSEPKDGIDHGLVNYSARQDEFGVFCKAHHYAYQREYRFVLGECGHIETTAKQVRCPGGFKDILFLEPTIRILGQSEKELLLVLDKDGCRMMLNDLPEEATEI